MTKFAAVLAVTAATLLLGAGGASAHTDSDVIAVPAGEEAVVTLKPTHGCDGSPTVEVAIQAPVTGAVAEEVDGWTATSTDDGDGNTVLEWKGGSLPADQTGEFPVRFLAPDTVGELLTFPSVQTCEDGEELSWISGDPADEFPAPRLLILAPGSEPAAELAEIPADAPGRDQLPAIVDIDNPQETTVPPTDAAPADPETTSAPETTGAAPESGDEEVAAPPVAADARDDDGDDSSTLPLVAGGLVVLALVGGGAFVLRSRSNDAP